MLVIEVDEVGAVDVIVGASGCIGYPISSLEQLDPNANGPATFSLPFLYKPGLAQIMRIFWAGTSFSCLPLRFFRQLNMALR